MLWRFLGEVNSPSDFRDEQKHRTSAREIWQFGRQDVSKQQMGRCMVSIKALPHLALCRLGKIPEKGCHAAISGIQQRWPHVD
jgi:hypothetical protein